MDNTQGGRPSNGRFLCFNTSGHPMDNASTRAQLLEHFLSFFLPEELALPVMSNQKMNDALKLLFKHI